MIGLILIVCFATLLLCALAGIRNQITCNVRIRRVEIVHGINVQRLDSHDWSDRASPNLIEYNCDRSYDAMMWDLRKWTYAQFFPEGY